MNPNDLKGIEESIVDSISDDPDMDEEDLGEECIGCERNYHENDMLAIDDVGSVCFNCLHRIAENFFSKD